MAYNFEALYLAWLKQMLLVAMKILHNQTDAEDAVHNAFLRISRQMQKLPQEPRALRAYMLTAAKHAALDLLPGQPPSADLESLHLVDSKDLFAQVAASEDYARLLAAIESLPDKYRDVLMLHYVQELKTEEIATLLGRSPTAIRKQLQRGAQFAARSVHNRRSMT